VEAVRPPRGYTLIEVVVALGLLSIVMLGAGGLIMSSARLGERAVRSIRDPDVEIVVLRLRRDVQTASGLVGPVVAGGWTDEPLLVRTSDAAVVGYGFDGAAVRRWTWAPDGTSRDSAVVLDGVTAWRWRWPGGSAVDVQLDRPSVAGDDGATRRETWRFAIRDGENGGW